MTTLISLLLFLNPSLAKSSTLGVRTVSASSCEVTKINLGLGLTTQIVFEQEPKLTLYADKKHFKITSNDLAPRSLAIIPFFEANELNPFRDTSGALLAPDKLANALNRSFKTNLFVFFKNNNQLMFELKFSEKEKADYVVKVKQTFGKDCAL